MKIDFNLIEKLREIITPSYNQALNAKRSDRLNKFFTERRRIQNLDEPDNIKLILLNSAAAELSGVKNAKFEELEYFLETSNADDFEMKYWTFAWNRAGFIVSRDESGKIIDISSTLSKRIKIRILNIFLILAMSIWPFLFLMKKDPFINLGFNESAWHLFIFGVSTFCLVTVVKILYDWSHWQSLNMTLAGLKQPLK
ncbi:hypothetical protein F895_00204 [Acinetobacter sp. CIP 64.2]|uniref:hypothetical protein n=1 Tax=unclassified Acinetobacter TaxID=196816 RepID=UPI000289D64F|nr:MULTISPECIES: hypothetical protein [unclassified Acinetobacter]ENX18135.1 hypothetical protein F895_00204 [Acinetobacter sp. CIP 64.2]